MSRKLLLTAAAALLLMTLSAAAYADPLTLAQGQTVTYTFQTPVLVGTTATVTYKLQGNQLLFTATNTSSSNARINGIGINTPTNVTVTNPFFFSELYAFGYSTGSHGLGNMEITSSNAVNDTLNAGQSGNAIFTLSAAPPFIVFDGVTVQFIDLPDGITSAKVPGVPGAPIPEPATMFLLGSGLVGVAAKLRKRRNAAREQ